MPISRLASRVKQLVTAVSATPATGQGPLTLGAAYDSSVQRFNDACVSGTLYSYMIKEGTKWEYGRGTPTSGGSWTFDRTTVKKSSAGVGVKEVFTTACVIWITPNEDDFTDTDPRGRHALFIAASGFKANMTNGASITILETTTNKNMLVSLDFDPATVESVQIPLVLPPSYDGGVIRCRAIWKHLATTTNFGVMWCFSAVARGDNEAGDAAFGTAVSVSDTGGVTNNIYVTAETADITIAGTPQPLDLMTLKVERLATDGADTLAVDAQLLGIELFFGVNASTD